MTSGCKQCPLLKDCCREELCAWYDGKRCAVARLPGLLEDVAHEIEALTRTIDSAAQTITEAVNGVSAEIEAKH